MYLIFDTETSGLPAWNLLPSDFRQPHIVQLACLLLDAEFKEKASFKTLIKPEGWTIDPGAEAAHGISIEQCEEFGIPIAVALKVFDEFTLKADHVVAHNAKFDTLMIDIELASSQSSIQYNWKNQTICTMLASTNACKLPGTKGRYKWPKLAEAYKFFFNEELQNAHDAMVDVRACARILKHLIETRTLSLATERVNVPPSTVEGPVENLPSVHLHAPKVSY